MKKILLPGLLCLCFATSAIASTESIESLIEQGQYEKAENQLRQATKAKPQSTENWRLLALVYLQQRKLDDAEDIIEKALKLTPDDAKVQFTQARIMVQQAQEASIFSAPGYAKKSLKAFKRAVELSPENIAYRDALMNYYLGAPSIVGGDNKLALAEAQAIYKLDKKQGLAAKLSAYKALEDKNNTEAVLKEMANEYPKDLSLLLTQAMHWQAEENWSKTFDALFAITDAKDLNDQDKQLQLSAMYQIGKTSSISRLRPKEGLDALQGYIDSAPTDAALPPLDWANYRKALLMEQLGDTDKAKDIYRKLKSSSSDKQLIKLVKKQL